eukprot:SAG31_NODE_1689_length_7525_cov_3.264745_2_plen_55_part_00
MLPLFLVIVLFAQVGGLHAVQELLPHDEAGKFPRLSGVKVDVLEGKDVVIGGRL